MEFAKIFLGGAGGAAVVTGIVSLIQWLLSRRAQKADRVTAKTEAENKREEKLTKEINRKLDVLLLADRTVLYDRIKFLAKSYIDRGWVTVEELEDLNRMHDVYHDPDKLDGNGFLKDLMKTVNSLEKKAK